MVGRFLTSRLPSDIMFFPSVVAKVNAANNATVVVDDEYAELEAELTQMEEESFDSKFEAVFAKMLRIGTTGLGGTIANRPKGEGCPAV